MQNFNMGFSNNKSEVLIHLTQWQYWWWFWFSFLWGLYYLLVARVIRYRTLKFNPRISSTLRPHGKWGDLLTCLIPIIWCINILINSNYILKITEWQSESSLFTLRVRAKQWYWIYKLDLRNISDIMSTPRNMGKNKWQSSLFGELQNSEDYLHILQMRAHTLWNVETLQLFEKYSKPISRSNSLLPNIDHKYDCKNTINNVKNPKNFFQRKLVFLLNRQHIVANNYLRFKLQKSIFGCSLYPRNFIFFNPNKTYLSKNIKIFNSSNSYLLKNLMFSNLDSYNNRLYYKYYNKCNLYNNDRYVIHTLSDSFDLYNQYNLITKSFKTNVNINDIIYYNYNFKKFKLNRSIFSHNCYISSKYKNTSFKKFYLNKYNDQNFFKNSLISFTPQLDLKINFNFKQTNINDFLENYFFTFYDKCYQNKFTNSLIGEPVKIKTRVLYENTNNLLYNKYFQKSSTQNKLILAKPNFEDEDRTLRRSYGKKLPITILKTFNDLSYLKESLIQENISTTSGNILSTKMFKFNYNFSNKFSTLGNKPIKDTVYLTFKQKRYNQRVKITSKKQNFFSQKFKTNYVYSGNPFLKNVQIFEENFGIPTKQYRMLKKAKSRSENTRIPNWNRLLRSRRILVLPAHVNITVITNSFDIVHSWHIPGLGLKMDCLPGRATHHTLHIDNVGLYYGQCAEICGRYHHHMPIRICALPFEHFLVWWHTFAMPKFIYNSQNPNKAKDLELNTIPFNISNYSSRKFSW